MITVLSVIPSDLRDYAGVIKRIIPAHSPPRNVSIEGARILEHAVERGCVAHIPLRNVTIKGGFVQKRIAEIGHIAHIPIGHNRVTEGGGIIDTKPRHWLLCQTIVNGGYDIVILEKINRQIQRIVRWVTPSGAVTTIGTG